MVDQPFTSWALPALSPRTTARTLDARIADVFNVKDFGATGSGSGDDHAAIEAALAASANGGIVFFPPGTYQITSPITLPNDHAKRIILGSGPSEGGSNATLIRGTLTNGYLLYSAQNASGSNPVSAIRDISFQNSYAATKGTFTKPDVGVVSGGTGGCVYLPNSSWVSIENCQFAFRSGVAIYFPGICNSADAIVIDGGSDGDVTTDTTIGIWGTACSLTNGKIHHCTYAIVTLENPTYIYGWDIELCQNGIWANNPFPYWDRNTNSTITTNSSFHNFYLYVGGIQFESGGVIPNGGTTSGGCYIRVSGSGTYENIRINSLSQDGRCPDHGIRLDLAYSSRFNRIDAGGKFAHAVYSYTDGGSNIGGNQWRNVSHENIVVADGVTSGTGWQLWSVRQAYSGEEFIDCTTDGAVPFNLIGVTGGITSSPQLITDSTVPTWSGTVSNVGKPVVGGGSNKVWVRWNGTAWAIAG